VRWSDALKEAGLTPNTLQKPHDEDDLIGKYIAFTRELGHVPVKGELLLKGRNDPNFPGRTYEQRWYKAELAARVLDYCRKYSGFEDVVQLFASIATNGEVRSKGEQAKRGADGSVYLMKMGRHYKIGKTNAVGRREYELKIQLPQTARTVHVIQTDDPTGIEAYWHNRFATKRGNGEWFELDASDVAAFKRRKFM
jgi:hypothetical protein